VSIFFFKKNILFLFTHKSYREKKKWRPECRCSRVITRRTIACTRSRRADLLGATLTTPDCNFSSCRRRLPLLHNDLPRTSTTSNPTHEAAKPHRLSCRTLVILSIPTISIISIFFTANRINSTRNNLPLPRGPSPHAVPRMLQPQPHQPAAIING
jgi:hypothetical protein